MITVDAIFIIRIYNRNFQYSLKKKKKLNKENGGEKAEKRCISY